MILAEFDLAITFCRLAETASDERKRERITAKAETALEVATRYVRRIVLTPEMRRTAQERKQLLEFLLAQVRTIRPGNPQ